MAPLFKLSLRRHAGAAGDPIERPMPWPNAMIVVLIVAGLISPLICLAGAAFAYALADPDQGMILTGAGLAHLVLGLTLLSAV